MQASNEKLTLWGTLKEHGDINSLSGILSLSPQQTSTILKTGNGKVKHIRLINEFYNKRKKEIEAQNA